MLGCIKADNKKKIDKVYAEVVIGDNIHSAEPSMIKSESLSTIVASERPLKTNSSS